ncbi:hypothetical protein FHS96_001137 [Sphingomonas zeicaulis]|uniref:hypothetical protein n=1 Tax=Sphingomonas zeicaulis TaxID=1632740 RepID=UPI003D1BC5C0
MKVGLRGEGLIAEAIEIVHQLRGAAFPLKEHEGLVDLKHLDGFGQAGCCRIIERLIAAIGIKQRGSLAQDRFVTLRGEGRQRLIFQFGKMKLCIGSPLIDRPECHTVERFRLHGRRRFHARADFDGVGQRVEGDLSRHRQQRITQGLAVTVQRRQADATYKFARCIDRDLQ